jgi:hypothetical protein
MPLALPDKCDVPFFTMENFSILASRHPLYWEAPTVAMFVLTSGSSNVALSEIMNPYSALMFWNNDISGPAFMSIDPDDLVSIGITRGAGISFSMARDQWIESNKILAPSQKLVWVRAFTIPTPSTQHHLTLHPSHSRYAPSLARRTICP